MTRLLITTALDASWRDDVPVLFLGEWCRRYSRRARWSAMDAAVLPYHWDDREKFHADYAYLLDLYERLLPDVSLALNGVHGVDRTPRYWRMLIGPWLGYFTQVLFDRWTCLQQALGRGDVSGSIVLTAGGEPLVPNDMADFTRRYVEDEWNHHLCASILRQFTDLPCVERRGDEAAAAGPQDPVRWHRRLRRGVRTAYGIAARPFARDEDAFFLATYLPVREQIRLSLRLGQAPVVWRSAAPVQAAPDRARRQWQVPGDVRSRFEACARALIPQQIPAAYLEGYAGLCEQARGMGWPKRPSLIWTSTAFSADDVFKAWAGEKIEAGSPLVLGQHGGHYGIGRCSFAEDHEVAVSDAYMTWGWTEAAQPKLRAVSQFSVKRPLGVRHAAQPGAVLVTAALPRQSVTMFSIAVAGQWLGYFDDQCRFVRALPAAIQDALVVRMHDPDRGWDQRLRWRDRFPSLRLDEGRVPLDDLVRRSRLYIATYNATTFLESFTQDVPTVIFWNPDHWELRASAVPYFEALARVGLFHTTPESAARHVARVWDDVEAWWTGADVRAVLQAFTTRYCYAPSDRLDRVERVLRSVRAEAATRSAAVPASEHVRRAQA